MITIRTAEKTLTDGSKVYNVEILQAGNVIDIPVTTESEAEELSATILAHINNVTVEDLQAGDRVYRAA